MFKLLKSLIQPTTKDSAAVDLIAVTAHTHLEAPGVTHFDVAAAMRLENSLPVMDWAAAERWVESVADADAQARAWADCELAWLSHLRDALGGSYQLRRQGSALLLSSLEPNVAAATLAFVIRTVQRIVRVLDGVAESPAWGHDILIVFDDQESYYRYVAQAYPEAGEFAASSGMYIHAGCGHFVTVKDDLQTIEPVIAHELTHACLGHLPIPAWLNEGLAVNTENRLCPSPHGMPDARRQHARHLAFWGEAEIQQFWSGKSFLRNDEGNELSYDLARILVSHFAADWERFRGFARAANLADAGAAAAHEHLGMDLGEAVCAVLEREADVAWAPRAEMWNSEPERGAF
ncbi:hypothetical protein GCM10025770_22050 [Viridibacterium curvum]|uniref:Peptidase MA-like domain-containing protein n=2 Tax=Viridibacterium curvum TaxID=1101404 RepID=A0ABP9QQX1_9RHOO